LAPSSVPPLLKGAGIGEVVLSRRPAVLAVAMVVAVLALGVIGLLGVVSASPTDTQSDANGDILTVLTKSREAEDVDLSPRGASQGDMRVVNAPLYDESGAKRIGRLDLYCVTTDPADKPNESANMEECASTYTLPGGEISVLGVTAFPKLSVPPRRGVNAISGGTGKYAGVRGEVHIETRGNEVIITFHLIG
jgi:hypothetical protein